MFRQGRRFQKPIGSNLVWLKERKIQIYLSIGFMLIVFGALPMIYLSTAPPETIEERHY